MATQYTMLHAKQCMIGLFCIHNRLFDDYPWLIITFEDLPNPSPEICGGSKCDSSFTRFNTCSWTVWCRCTIVMKHVFIYLYIYISTNFILFSLSLISTVYLPSRVILQWSVIELNLSTCIPPQVHILISSASIVRFPSYFRSHAYDMTGMGL